MSFGIRLWLLLFIGTTSLDVYCIIPMLSPAFSSNYNLSFTLDDQPIPQTFMLFNNSSPVIQFNVSVLVISNLAPISHVFTMIAASRTESLIVRFNYARYTFDDSRQSSMSSSTISETETPSSDNDTQASI
ncbi:hypothetical protein C8R42DRAFT_657704 [Lentinula raphanica]|nr:hypothetical protein C8R42DRAFT_657704 [Lentinula raphanica]